MTTIRLVDPSTVTAKTKEIFDPVPRREGKAFGTTAVSSLGRRRGRSADYLEANWNRPRALWSATTTARTRSPRACRSCRISARLP